MNTETKAKPTKGPWKPGGMSDGSPDAIVDPDGFEVAYVNPYASSHGNGEHEANAELIAEAGTVYHETGLTPREILDQRDFLLRAMEYVRDNHHEGQGQFENFILLVIESCGQKDGWELKAPIFIDPKHHDTRRTNPN